ncbi:hypothetical protein VDG1235_4577 [Verrucomicrobiia bacterium DG1235]|nr:hypothetical protein VDG1235_4577 [Verrucomicrobiae bacterium DG1235]
MRLLDSVRAPLLCVVLALFASSARADFETFAIGSAIDTLDHFMQAGVDRNPSRGAILMESFEVDERRTEYETRRLYRRERDLLAGYVSISSDIYGYEIEKSLFGTSVEVEGGIETEEGLTAEFRARVVYRGNRWLIAHLEIE